jgi:hypothetical protein
MSKIALTPNASGTGVFTISSPATNTNRTLTLPDEAGTVLTSASSITQNAGPAFAARPSSGQSAPSNSTFTKVVFDTETFDTDGKFATSRFTPTVAGYYQINGGVSYANANYTARNTILAIYKNNSNILATNTQVGGYEARHGVTVSGIVYLDADDYVELFIWGPNQALDAGTETFFNGAMVRAV